jgi:predicted dehydrogenase
MKTYRAAVIGCGLIGSRAAADASRIGVYTHAGAYAACERTTLCALADRDPLALAAAGKRWGVAACYPDLEALLAEVRPEIVSICTPDGSHAALLRRLLACDSVRAVFAEKPLALSVAEARATLAGAGPKPVLVNYSRRFTANHRALKQCLEAGALGEIVAVQGVYTKGLFHNGTHWLDLARWLVGEISQVRAFDTLHETGPDPTLDLRLGFAFGATGVLTGLSHRNYSIFEMDLLGTAGRARLTDSGWSIDVSLPGASPHNSGYTVLGRPGQLPGGMRDATLNALQNLVAHLDDPRAALACTGADGLQALVIAEAARRSLATQQAETVPASAAAAAPLETSATFA